MNIIIATHNKDKCNEILSEDIGDGIILMTLDDFPNIGEIEETGDTLKENALLKARTVYSITGLPTIADDTGLEVNALDGSPGVLSARYAGEGCSYDDNINKLLNNMKSIPKINRKASFITIMSYVDKNVELIAKGMVKGNITTEPKGVGGFGYDPVFYVPELDKTFAEINMKEKNKISHRGNAIRELFSLLIENSIIPSKNREEPA